MTSTLHFFVVKSLLIFVSTVQVKADRGEIDSGDQSFEQMQERTKHAPHQKNSGKQ